MNHLLNFAAACVILGVFDCWKHGWLPLQKPASGWRGHLAIWLVDRTYLIYAAMAAAALVASALIGR